MQLKTANENDIKPYLNKLVIPAERSHKGQNGKLLIIGGSQLFHAASLWAADISCHIVDMVHYSSTEENEAIFIQLKSRFPNGIIVKKSDLHHYIVEDDAVLAGPGMVRGEIDETRKKAEMSFEQLVTLDEEVEYSYFLTNYLITTYPDKQFIFDAGALQMLDKKWLLNCKKKPILTPHVLEFEKVFTISIADKSTQEIADIATKTAQEYNCLLLIKAVDDIVTNGTQTVIITGGNAGLTKGGTGDTLAGLCAALTTKNDPFLSAVIASYLVKKSAEILFSTTGFWYSTTELIAQIPKTLRSLIMTR